MYYAVHCRYHMGHEYYGPIASTIILIIAIVILLVVIMGNRKNNSMQIQEPLEMLRERYANGEIEAAEYRRKKDVVENEECQNQATLILMKRYVNQEISEEEYTKIKKDIS